MTTNPDTTEPVYNAAHFIAKFEAIPEPLWYGGGGFYKPGESNCRCAFGHCGQLESDAQPPEAAALAAIEDKMIGSGSPFLVFVNDGRADAIEKFPQPTPKQRVLAWLRDAKEAGL